MPKPLVRIFHQWDKWECYPAGFYENSKKGMTKDQCETAYKELLSNSDNFRSALSKVLLTWKNSCEHYLTNEKMNRIAWLGQASLCIELGIPSCFRSGYFLLSKKEQQDADIIALKYLNIWLELNGYESNATLEDAGVNAQANIY